MSRATRLLLTAFDGVSRVSLLSAIGAGLMTVALMAVVCYEVTMRYVVNRPVSWASEVPELMLLVLVWCGVAYTAHIGGHVKLDVVTSRLPQRGRALALLTIFSSLVALIVSSIYVWQGILIFKSSLLEGWHTPTLVPVIIWPWLVFFPAGCFLMSLEWLKKVMAALRELRQLDHRKV